MSGKRVPYAVEFCGYACAGSADKSVDSVGSADKSVGLLHLYTLRNALKISLVQTKSAECRQIAQKVL